MTVRLSAAFVCVCDRRRGLFVSCTWLNAVACFSRACEIHPLRADCCLLGTCSVGAVAPHQGTRQRRLQRVSSGGWALGSSSSGGRPIKRRRRLTPKRRRRSEYAAMSDMASTVDSGMAHGHSSTLDSARVIVEYLFRICFGSSIHFSCMSTIVVFGVVHVTNGIWRIRREDLDVAHFSLSTPLSYSRHKLRAASARRLISRCASIVSRIAGLLQRR